MSFVLLLVDEKVSTGNTYLYIMDPDTGRTWKTDYQIPEGSVVFQVASVRCFSSLSVGSYLLFIRLLTPTACVISYWEVEKTFILDLSDCHPRLYQA